LTHKTPPVIIILSCIQEIIIKESETFVNPMIPV
jgi:hypothetical protein